MSDKIPDDGAVAFIESLDVVNTGTKASRLQLIMNMITDITKFRKQVLTYEAAILNMQKVANDGDWSLFSSFIDSTCDKALRDVEEIE